MTTTTARTVPRRLRNLVVDEISLVDVPANRLARIVLHKRGAGGGFAAAVPIASADDDKRLVMGWASVVEVDGEPVVDSQGDIISREDLEEVAHAFLRSARVGKVMHSGPGAMEVVQSAVVTPETACAMGMTTDRTGWWVVAKVHDDGAWRRVKSGELRALSIGGTAVREPVGKAEQAFDASMARLRALLDGSSVAKSSTPAVADQDAEALARLHKRAVGGVVLGLPAASGKLRADAKEMAEDREAVAKGAKARDRGPVSRLRQMARSMPLPGASVSTEQRERLVRLARGRAGR